MTHAEAEDSVAHGVKAAVWRNVTVLVLLLGLTFLHRDPSWLFTIGIFQFLYLPVTAFRERRRGRALAAKGVWIVVGVTFLLSAATCTGAILVTAAMGDH